MSINGVLTEVRWEWDGTELTDTFAIGETVLSVLSATAVAVDEQVWIDFTGPYTITAIDEDADTITISPGLETDCEEGIEVVPDVGGNPAQVWVAEVALPDAEKPIEVPLTIKDLSVMSEGEYDPPVAIIISDDYQSVIDLPGSLPVVDGTYIPTDTLPEPEGPTDPPVSSPLLSASGSATAITVVAHGVVEPTTILDYYMDDVLMESTRSTVMVFRSDSTGAELDLDSTYTIYVIARNDVGEAAPSASIEGRLNAAVSDETILAVVQSGFVLAGAIQVGNITIDPDTGITIPLATGGYIQFPADGSPAVIEAILRTSDLSVNGGLSINGITNFLNGKVFLAAGTANPATQTDLADPTGFPRTTRLTAIPVNSSQSVRGLAKTSAGTIRYGTIQWMPTGSEKTFRILSSTGTVLWDSITSDDELLNMSGVTNIGQYFYVLGMRWNASAGESQWRVHVYDVDGVQQGGAWIRDMDGNRIVQASAYFDGAIAADGFSIWVSKIQANGRMRLYKYTWTDWGLNVIDPDETLLGPSDDGWSSQGGAFYVGNADFGSKRFILGGNRDGVSGQHAYSVSGSSLVYQSGDSFGTTEGWTKGLIYDGTQFVGIAHDATGPYLHNYSTNKTAVTVYAKHTWYDTNATGGNKESAASPVNSRSIPARMWPVVGVPAPPNSGSGTDAANAVRLYLGLTSTVTLYSTITTGAAATQTVTAFTGDGVTTPPATTTFPLSSATGEIAGADGEDYFRGSGAFNFGGISGTGDGKATADPLNTTGFVPVGGIMAYATATAPSGWLLCNGGTFSSVTYPALAAVVGDQFGTHSGTTYYLPDIRRRVVMGHYNSIADSVLGESDDLTNLADRTPAHDHTAAGLGTGSAQGMVDQTAASGGAVNLVTRGSAQSHTHNVNGDTGNALALNSVSPDRQFPYISLNYIIRAV